VPQLAMPVSQLRRTLVPRCSGEPRSRSRNLMLSSMHSDSGGALSDARSSETQQVRQLDAAELICAGTAASTLEPRYNLS
jgi:hypothetical protein